MSSTQDFLVVCEEAVRRAGQLLVERMGRVKVREKGPNDLVTEADWASQELVRQSVLSAFPDHCVLGEEDPASGGEQGEYRWIVDPLDGTTNYVHGFPFFSVSLALERRGELLVGAIFNPLSQECFTAVAGGGARLNGQVIQCSSISDLSGAIATAGLPGEVSRNSPDLLSFIEAAYRCQSIRRTGSASLNLAFVAAGRADLFWSYSTKVWDIAAGALLVREAGGTVTSPDGGPLRLDRGLVLAAANASLHEQFGQLLARVAS